MKNIKKFFINSIFLTIFLYSFPISSQEINKEFLDSLPKSIQKDFLNQDSDEDFSENYNDRPETRILKIENGIDAIKNQVRSMESQINREVNSKADLNLFGSSFFDSYQTSFAPINQQNFVSDYVIDIGDVLSVQTLGESGMSSKIPVSRDGTINIPDIGIIPVAGMPYEDALDAIEQYVSKKYIGIEVYVNLEFSRDMNILLIGNAVKPGIYTLPGGSSILSLLHAAGGIDRNGGYRSILHKRNNKVIQEIDLYDVLIKGNLLFSTPLRSGDSVIIGPLKRVVSISGGINTPAMYELKDGENLSDLIDLSQGFSESSMDEVEIFRATGEHLKLAKNEANMLKLLNGDSVKIPLFSPASQSTLTVTVDGAVRKPGTYSFTYGATLHEIIDLAGGYTENAYPYGGSLYRKKVADIQKETFNKTYSALINYLASNSNVSGLSSSQNLQVILGELKASKFKGRLSAEFIKRKVSKDPSLDTVLADGDEVHIPFFTSDVFVSGDILHPGGRRYDSNLDYKDYIRMSGGTGRFADKNRIIVIKPNGDADVVQSKLFFGNSGPQIYPGSIIYVPKEIGKLEGISYTATLAPIVSSLALSLASLNSIN